MSLHYLVKVEMLVRAIIESFEKATPKFIRPQLWHPNLPELSPVDYSVCEILQKGAKNTRRLTWKNCNSD